MQLSQQIAESAKYFIDSNKFYYLLLDQQGRIKYGNPLLLKRLGIKNEEIESLSFSDFFQDNEEFQFKKACEYLLATSG